MVNNCEIGNRGNGPLHVAETATKYQVIPIFLEAGLYKSKRFSQYDQHTITLA